MLLISYDNVSAILALILEKTDGKEWAFRPSIEILTAFFNGYRGVDDAMTIAKPLKDMLRLTDEEYNELLEKLTSSHRIR